MNKHCSIRRQDHIERSIYLSLLLVGVAVFTNGCFALQSKHLSKPDGPAGSVRLMETNNYLGWVFEREFNSNEFNLKVSALDSEDRGGVGFWFYVLPLPFASLDNAGADRLTVEIQIEPKGRNIQFDPSKTFYVRDGLYRTSAAQVFTTQTPPKYGHAYRVLKYEVISNAAPVTTNTWFILEYEARGHPGYPFTEQFNPDTPFTLLIEGLSADGQSVSIPPIKYQRKIIFRPEFKLPY